MFKWRKAQADIDLDSLVWAAPRRDPITLRIHELARVCTCLVLMAIIFLALSYNTRVPSTAAASQSTPSIGQIQKISEIAPAALLPTSTPLPSLEQWQWPTSTPQPTPTMPAALPLHIEPQMWQWPLHNARLTQDFSAEHPGWDLAGWIGYAVFAAADGKVDFADWNSEGYGYLVIIDHGGGLRSYYGHLQYIVIPEGQWVHASDQIGTMGGTGNADGWHLHFEIRLNGQSVYPGDYLR